MQLHSAPIYKTSGDPYISGDHSLNWLPLVSIRSKEVICRRELCAHGGLFAVFTVQVHATKGKQCF